MRLDSWKHEERERIVDQTGKATLRRQRRKERVGFGEQREKKYGFVLELKIWFMGELKSLNGARIY